VARIELWNGDICDLEVDAIVNAANLSLWMSTGVGGAIKQAGGEEIEFAAVRQAPVSLGGAVVTPAGRLAAGAVIHAVSLDRDRRTSGPIIEAAVRSTMERAREIAATSIAFPALGTGVGGFPLEEAARITVQTVRDELQRSPTIQHVIFALRGAAVYQAFQAALSAPVAVGPGRPERPEAAATASGPDTVGGRGPHTTGEPLGNALRRDSHLVGRGR
jgi:O-acetyl-ADP-ribose deacetylase (regulator of RNase III)